jgi:hypothetical protein
VDDYDYDGDEPTGDFQMLVNEDTQRIMAYGHEHPRRVRMELAV